MESQSWSETVQRASVEYLARGSAIILHLPRVVQSLSCMLLAPIHPKYLRTGSLYIDNHGTCASRQGRDESRESYATSRVLACWSISLLAERRPGFLDSTQISTPRMQKTTWPIPWLLPHVTKQPHMSIPSHQSCHQLTLVIIFEACTCFGRRQRVDTPLTSYEATIVILRLIDAKSSSPMHTDMITTFWRGS